MAPPAGAQPLTSALTDATAVVDAINQADPANAPQDRLVRADFAYGTPWRAYKVRIPEGGHTWSQIRILTNTNTAVVNYYVLWLRPDGSLFAGAGNPGSATLGVRYRDGDVVVSQGVPQVGPGLVGSYAGDEPYAVTPAGDYTAIFFAPTKGTFAGTFEIYGSPGVRVLRSTEGQDAFIYDITDFNGRNETNFVNGEGTTSVQGKVSASIRHRVFLFANRNTFAPGSLTYDDPSGVNHEFDIYGMLRNGAPGRYVFHLETDGDPSPTVSGAGIVMP